jgi:transcription elongation factor GreB
VVSIVGTDEVDLNRNYISWVSPLGRALMKSAAGDGESFKCRAVQNT